MKPRLQPIRIGVVGDEDSGKEGVLISFTKSKTENYGYVQLEGEYKLDRKRCSLTLYDMSSKTSDVDVRQSVYSDCDVLMIFFSYASTTSFESIEKKWLIEIQPFITKYHPVIIVGTKYDNQVNGEVDKKIEEMREYCKNIQELVSCSAGNIYGLSNVFDSACSCFFNAKKNREKSIQAMSEVYELVEKCKDEVNKLQKECVFCKDLEKLQKKVKKFKRRLSVVEGKISEQKLNGRIEDEETFTRSISLIFRKFGYVQDGLKERIDKIEKIKDKRVRETRVKRMIILSSQLSEIIKRLTPAKKLKKNVLNSKYNKEVFQITKREFREMEKEYNELMGMKCKYTKKEQKKVLKLEKELLTAMKKTKEIIQRIEDSLVPSEIVTI